MRADTRAAVDREWAAVFGISVADLHRSGTTAVQHVGLGDYPGIYVLMLGPSVIISSPAEPSEDFTEVLGPSVHAYLDTVPDGPLHGVREASYDELTELRRAAGEAAWTESGFGDEPARCFVLSSAGRIVAASNLTTWRGEAADVGVLVDPSSAGRGLGTRMVAAAAAEAVRVGGIARYRALASNHASLAIASRLGFTNYGRNLAIKPRPRPTTG